MIRISDANAFDFVQVRMQQVQREMRRLQQQLVTGQRLTSPTDDPLGASVVVRSTGQLAALSQYGESASFGGNVLASEDDALDTATNLMVRAEELASQQASQLYDASQRAAAREEVHGILKQMTAVANTEFAGRRIFGGLALDAAAPFTDPDTPGWTAATAYVGSTYEPEFKVGSGASERVRVATRGDTVFGASLAALESLEATLAGTGPVSTQLAGLQAARGGLTAERGSIGARERQLQDRTTQIQGLTLQEQSARSTVRDTDFAAAASDFAAAQTAMQALLAAASQIKETSLAGLLKL